MSKPWSEPVNRTHPSRVLADSRKKGRSALDLLEPGRKMEATFALSMDARTLMAAGLRARGFSETEVCKILRAKRR